MIEKNQVWKPKRIVIGGLGQLPHVADDELPARSRNPV